IAKELGVRPRQGSALYWIDRQFRKTDLRKFLSWAQKQDDEMVLFQGQVGTQFQERLVHCRELTQKARQRHKDYLKARRATYKMMRQSHHPRWALEAYRADEIAATENEVVESEETLAWIESDLELLEQPDLVEAYRQYAAEVMDRIGIYHLAYNAKDPS
ncbi:MAG: hypothetical protein V3S11_01540, partial [Elusimicrobiota bacterium]